MNGLELSEKYFETYGKPMLDADFKELLPYLCVGFVGSGSDRLGYDDSVSTDHDFEPGFCIFLPGEDVVSRRDAFLLERAYYKLPKEFMGYTRPLISPVGGNRNGVIRTEDFYLTHAGTKDGLLTNETWLHLPDYALKEATNGKIFFDNYGEFTKIRNYLKTMPEDVRLKRLAGNLLLMAQSGQYNYPRCLSHGEKESAQLALYEFVKATLQTLFLLNREYMPYYKWSFRGLKNLPCHELFYAPLSSLLSGDIYNETLSKEKCDTVEDIASKVITLLNEQSLTKAVCGDLEKHAYSVNDRIEDGTIRNLNILTCV